jgi:hypothetical protein
MTIVRATRRHTRCVAKRVTDDNLADVADWVNGHTWATSVVVPTIDLIDGHWRTGETPAAPGDWVLKLPDSRWQVVDDDTFRVEWMVAR